jgi:hypothetical protein
MPILSLNRFDFLFLFQLDSYFVSTFGYLCYLDMNLKAVAKDLRNSYNRFVEISETVEDDFTYAKLLAIATVPEFVQQYDFCKVSISY